MQETCWDSCDFCLGIPICIGVCQNLWFWFLNGHDKRGELEEDNTKIILWKRQLMNLQRFLYWCCANSWDFWTMQQLDIYYC